MPHGNGRPHHFPRCDQPSMPHSAPPNKRQRPRPRWTPCRSVATWGVGRKVKKIFLKLVESESARRRTTQTPILPRYLSADGGHYGLLLRKAWDTFYPDPADGTRTPSAVLRSVADWPATSAGDMVEVPLLEIQAGRLPARKALPPCT